MRPIETLRRGWRLRAGRTPRTVAGLARLEVRYASRNPLLWLGAVVTAVVQGPGLGVLVFSGLSRIGSANSFPQVITGTLFCLFVALAFEILFAIISRLTIPRGIRV